jgi:hypothetical protein
VVERKRRRPQPASSTRSHQRSSKITSINARRCPKKSRFSFQGRGGYIYIYIYIYAPVKAAC